MNAFPNPALVERRPSLRAEHPRRHLRPPAPEFLEHAVDLEAPERARQMQLRPLRRLPVDRELLAQSAVLEGEVMVTTAEDW